MAFIDHHSRSDSSDTSSTASSYQHILDHVLTYNAGYEMPLRTMYTLNSAPRAQPMPRSPPASSAGSSPTSPVPNGWQDHSTTNVFNENLMAQLSNLPTQPTSLPPSFITSFLGRCFPSDLVCVDFPQALTGLDYLKDLETRRQRDVASALSRTQIDQAILDSETRLLRHYPNVARWRRSMNEQVRIIESLYTGLYVGLRRWILINELSLSPFSKHNCVAMLNTLYPPFQSAPPTVKLTEDNLKKQREGFFKYISAVDKNGPSVLTNVIKQGMVGDDMNGWAPIVRQLQMYLQLTNAMINECSNLHELEDLEPSRQAPGKVRRTKTDSGVSMNGSEVRPTTASATTTSPDGHHHRPKTPSIGRGTTLEKLARGLKIIGRSKTDVTEISPREEMFTTSPQKPLKSLRKMRSMGDRSLRSAHGSDSPAFDVEEMRRHRLAYEAGQKPMASARSFEV